MFCSLLTFTGSRLGNVLVSAMVSQSMIAKSGPLARQTRWLVTSRGTISANQRALILADEVKPHDNRGAVGRTKLRDVCCNLVLDFVKITCFKVFLLAEYIVYH